MLLDECPINLIQRKHIAEVVLCDAEKADNGIENMLAWIGLVVGKIGTGAVQAILVHANLVDQTPCAQHIELCIVCAHMVAEDADAMLRGIGQPPRHHFMALFSFCKRKAIFDPEFFFFYFSSPFHFHIGVDAAEMSSSPSTNEQNNYEILFVGLCCAITFVGGKFLCDDVSDRAEPYLRHPLFISLTLFAAVWLATRNVKIACLITFFYLFFRELNDRCFCTNQ